MKVKLRVSCWQDSRTPDLKRRDENLEPKFWWARRRLEQRRQVSLVSRLGEVDTASGSTPGRQGDGPITEPDSGHRRAASHSTWQLLSVRSVQRGWTSVRRLLEGTEAA